MTGTHVTHTEADFLTCPPTWQHHEGINSFYNNNRLQKIPLLNIILSDLIHLHIILSFLHNSQFLQHLNGKCINKLVAFTSVRESLANFTWEIC